MRTYRKFLVLIVLAAVAACVAAAAPPTADAQNKARVVTRNLATGIIETSPWMDYDRALRLVFDKAGQEQSLTCWLEPKHHWFNPFHLKGAPLVRTYYLVDGRPSQHPPKKR